MFLCMTSCNGLSNSLPCASTLNLVQPNAKRRNNCQGLPALCDENTGPEKVLSNQVFLLQISRHRAEGGSGMGQNSRLPLTLAEGTLIWEGKGEAGEWVARGRCKVLLELKMFLSQCAQCHCNKLQHIHGPLSLGWMLKNHLHCLCHHHLQNRCVFSSLL